MIHIGANSRSTIVSKGISAGRSQQHLSRPGPGRWPAPRTCATSPSATACCSATSAAPTPCPISRSRNPTAQIEHEATTSKISDDQLFYAMQRGLAAGGSGRPDRQRLRPRGAAAAADGVRGRGAEAAGDQPRGERRMMHDAYAAWSLPHRSALRSRRASVADSRIGPSPHRRSSWRSRCDAGHRMLPTAESIRDRWSRRILVLATSRSLRCAACRGPRSHGRRRSSRRLTARSLTDVRLRCDADARPEPADGELAKPIAFRGRDGAAPTICAGMSLADSEAAGYKCSRLKTSTPPSTARRSSRGSASRSNAGRDPRDHGAERGGQVDARPTCSPAGPAMR